MKFNALFSIAVFVTALFLVSCDDDVNDIGSSIQPEIDDISINAGQVLLTAETVSLGTDFYVRTNKALLGTLIDPVFGEMKSDFLAEFFCANAAFELGNNDEAVVDSVHFQMGYVNSDFLGDDSNPMGVTIYEVTKELKSNFYTSVNPADYCDMNTILGKRFFTPKDLPNVDMTSTEKGKYFEIEIKKSVGENLYKEWKKNPTVLKNTNELKKYIKGVYVTSDFNDKALISFRDANSLIRLNIYYSYQIRKKDDSADSTVVRVLPLPISADALQLNSVKNSPLEEIKDDGEYKKTFIKAPAGVITKLTIPLGEIKKAAKEKTGTEKYIISSAMFKLYGLTEAEKDLDITRRPSSFIFINKDSLQNFFINAKMADAKTSIFMLRNSTNNSYDFSYLNTSARSNNIASLINHYIAEDSKLETLVYYVIPVDLVGSASSSTSATQYTSVANSFTPSAAIFKTEDSDLKMSLLFSKHNEVIEK